MFATVSSYTCHKWGKTGGDMSQERVKKVIAKKLLVAFVSGFGVFVILMLCLLIFSIKALYKDTNLKVNFARQHIDGILGHAKMAAQSTSHLLGRTCSESVMNALIHQVTLTPNVRSLELFSKAGGYCTSLYKEVSGVERKKIEQVNGLYLLAGDAATPSLPVLFYSYKMAQGTVLVGVDGYFIANTLRVINTFPRVYFGVSGEILSAEGRVTPKFSRMPEGYHVITSDYGYTIIYIITKRTILTNLIDNYSLGIYLSLLLGLFAMLALFLRLNRPLSITELIRNGIKNNEFVPYIQPIVDLKTNSVTGGEILIRWLRPGIGMIPPNQFIPAAEDSGLIVPMTRQLILDTREALRGRVSKRIHIGFNISQKYLQHRSIVADCDHFLQAFDTRQLELTLELVERDEIASKSEVKENFERLKGLGVTFALDDFGTGYSTYSYLQKFHVDYIKIDKSFIQMIGLDEISSHIVNNVIELAGSLHLKIIAEGVETEQQEAYLKAHDVLYLQGYRYSQPIPLQAFIRRYL
ncbi:EAL domain-containing protein [Edwardsiella tarda]|uniref:EAL domain-containing protein n=1 Tax=Edwardsiella tarda TaxID=636 RepID=UPI003F65D6F8